MTGPILLVAGAALILAGALAGGARARAIGLARVGTIARVASAGLGLVCVLAGAFVTGREACDSGTGRARFTISDELGPNQVSERVRVFFDGRDVGVLEIDQHSPKAQMAVTLGKPCEHHYRLVLERRLKGDQPTEATTERDIVILPDSHMVVDSDPRGAAYLHVAG
jgi:hypothetical protein